MIRLGLYERAEIRFVKRYVPVGSDVVELGASLGVVSAHIAAALSPRQKLVCVEANSTLRELWEGVMAGAAVDCVLVNAAVGPIDGGETAFWLDADPLCSRVSEGDSVLGQSVRVPQASLSALLRRHEINGRFTLVADVEGAEAAFIVGDDQAALQRCEAMIIELHDTAIGEKAYTWQDMRAVLLSNHQFVVKDERGPVLALIRQPQVGHEAKPAGGPAERT
jgi:FkbM family methyltransferase